MYAYMFFDDGCDSADVVLITVQVKAHAVRQAVDSFLNTPPTSADNKPVVKWLRSVNILCVMYRLLIVYRPCKLHSAALIVTPNSLYTCHEEWRRQLLAKWSKYHFLCFLAIDRHVVDLRPFSQYINCMLHF